MKKSLTILVMLFTFNQIVSQNAYNDAIKLRGLINEASGTFDVTPAKLKEVGSILFTYLNHPSSGIADSNFDIVVGQYQIGANMNPFISSYIPGSGSGSQSITDLTGKALVKIGETEVTKFADGLAKLIVDRTKKELQAAFFDRFIEELSSDKYKDIQTLFPSTYEVIKQLPIAIYSYEPYIDQLRDAFGVDLTSIYPHLEYVLTNGQYASFFENHKELKSVCLTALYFGDGLKNGKHIGVLIEDYNAANSKYQFSDAEIDFIKTNAIRFVQEVSKSFKINTNSDEYWVAADQIKSMMDDPITMNLYLGLLYQKVVPIVIIIDGTTNYGELLLDAREVKSFITELVTAIDDAQKELKNIQRRPLSDITIEEYDKSFNASSKVLRVFKNNSFISSYCENSVAFSSTQKANIKSFWKKYENIVDGSNATFSLFTNIKSKKYSSALGNVKTLYQLCFKPKVLENDNSKSKIDDNIITASEAKVRLNKIIDFLNEKGAFIAAVAKAENSAEVYNAIDKFAAPVGSSRVKRLSNTNVAVNAYCGLFVGQEQIKDVPNDKKAINAYGLTAPVGLSFSKGNSVLPWPLHQLIPAKGWSSTLFLSVIDIGAVAAYRFSNETAEQVPTIQVKDIFSPGIFWSVGIPKVPVSLNLGAQVGPNLRKVTDTTNDFSNNTYLRYSFSIVVDIPLLNLYTK